MSRWAISIVLLIGLAAFTGCSREADKDKNKGLDRPIPAEAPKGK
jgi:hypothetical protein